MTPIRPGTARRLALRPPQPRPAGIVRFERELTDEEFAEFKQRWAELDPRIIVVQP